MTVWCRQSTQAECLEWECATPLPPEILYQAGAKIPVGLNSTANVRLFAETAKGLGENVVHSGDWACNSLGKTAPECFILHNPERTQLTLTVPVDALKKIIKCYSRRRNVSQDDTQGEVDVNYT